MRNAERLCLAHFWVAFVAFLAASVLGTWQMWVRSPLGANVGTPSQYFMSVTAHGVSMAYVLTTFFIMGFGYFVAVTALNRPLPGRLWAWVAYWMAVLGVVLTVVTIAAGRASVLFTFYPPLTASVWFYIGLVLVVVASWIWCVLMMVAMVAWKRENPGRPVPLAMFATVANAVMWLWTTVGVAVELLFQVIPAALGLVQTIDVGLARTLFSWTLHAIVYFWLIPAYIAFYTMVPRAAGGRLYSDTMGRLTFILFLIYSLPVGMHHLLMDPEHGNATKFIQVLLTAFVAVPTLLTIFTITASLEIAGRLRGGRGIFGWIAALPWERPMVLATGLGFVMLGFGGFGGIINMGYGMNAMVHNTAWVTAHFHLIFGGSVVIMYFAIAYEIWPRLTGRDHPALAPLRLQLWLWFLGMMIMTLPWHWLGLQGQWRRVANFNYADPIIAGWGPWVVVSLGGGVVLLVSALLFVRNLAILHRGPALAVARPLYSLAVHPPHRVPAALNGFALWNVLVLVLMVAAYGYPIVAVPDRAVAECDRSQGRVGIAHGRRCSAPFGAACARPAMADVVQRRRAGHSARRRPARRADHPDCPGPRCRARCLHGDLPGARHSSWIAGATAAFRPHATDAGFAGDLDPRCPANPRARRRAARACQGAGGLCRLPRRNRCFDRARVSAPRRPVGRCDLQAALRLSDRQPGPSADDGRRQGAGRSGHCRRGGVLRRTAAA